MFTRESHLGLSDLNFPPTKMPARQTSVVTSVGDDKIEVREATPGDYEGVMAISDNIYDGLDYLPEIYHSFLNNPGANYYVLLKNDKIAAFKNFQKAVSGEHFTSMAVRVGDEHRGQGLMGKLHKGALHLFNLKYPDIKKVMMVAQWFPGVQAHLSRSKTGKVVLRRNFLVYKVPAAKNAITNFLDQSSEPAECETKQLNAAEIDQYITEPTINRLLGQENMLMYSSYWFPEIKEERIVQKILKDKDTLVFASFNTTTNEVTSFSHSQLLKSPFGDRIDIHHQGNNLSDLISHMTMHMRHLLESVTDISSLAMFILFSKEIPVANVEESLDAFGTSWISETFPVKECVAIVEDC